MNPGTVVVAGANGGFGRRAAEAFEAAGWTVRRYRRGSDLAVFAAGADVIVNGLNPSMYHNWPVLIPQITRQVIEAAKATGATVLMPGTVYVYGDQPGPWTEATPHRFTARKSRIRSEMEAAYRRAVAEDGLRVILLRGGDFIDPANPATLMNMMVLAQLRRGLMIAMAKPSVPRAYAYLPDMARAAVALAGKRAELAPYEEVNMPGLTFSLQDLRAEITRQTGRRPRLLPFPWWALRLAAPFGELARELLEMRYLYRTPHRLDGTKFTRLLPGFGFAPLSRIVAEELAALGLSASAKLEVQPQQSVA